MKHLLFLIALFATATAHSQCSEFDGLLQKGDNYLKGNKPNYQEAINAYTAAILACSGRAGEAKQRITRMVNEINKLKESAVAAEKKATVAQRNAETALANLEKANASTTVLLLGNADQDILNLRYEDALQKIKAASSLGAMKQEVAKSYLEIAFWHGEAGNIRRATALLDSIGNFMKNTAIPVLLLKIPANTAAARNRLWEAMKAIDADHFKFLLERKYYPEMVSVEGGKFKMGCDKNIDTNCENNEPLQETEVNSFRIARTETTVWQFALYCAAERLEIKDFLVSTWSDLGDNPVVNVSCYQALEYANWVSKQKGEKESITKDKLGEYAINLRAGYRLPTEAEWEYAAKGGKKPSRMTIYIGSNDLDSVGWYAANSGSRTRTVGKKHSNALGLYDMSGNVWEWCWDWYSDTQSDTENARVVRGGSWGYGPEYCRAVCRNRIKPAYHSDIVGFRLVFVQ